MNEKKKKCKQWDGGPQLRGNSTVYARGKLVFLWYVDKVNERSRWNYDIL